MAHDIGIWVAVAFAEYICGSFPTAYVLVKRFAHKNILE
jgi:glycerol-3-phosphate acyltransferase PlsY